jgi:hypothetical protein
MSRTIDYGLVGNGAHVTRVRVHGKRGSDHRLVIFEVRTPGCARWRVGLWNVRHDRRDRRVARLVARVVRLFDLDALLVCEAQEYRRELAREAHKTGLVVHQWHTHDYPGMAHQAIVTDPRRVSTEASWCRRATRSGWRTVRGGRTPAKFIPTVRLVDPRGRTLRVAVGHRPPSCRWVAGILCGPPRRVASTIGHARAEVRLLRGRPAGRPYLYAADWNAEPHARGRWSPAWVARRTGSRIAAPERSTHG